MGIRHFYNDSVDERQTRGIDTTWCFAAGAASESGSRHCFGSLESVGDVWSPRTFNQLPSVHLLLPRVICAGWDQEKTVNYRITSEKGRKPRMWLLHGLATWFCKSDLDIFELVFVANSLGTAATRLRGRWQRRWRCAKGKRCRTWRTRLL